MTLLQIVHSIRCQPWSIARTPQRAFSVAHHAAAVRRRAVEISGAPPTIAEIPDDDESSSSDIPRNSAVCIRQLGCTRRVFLLRPHLTAAQMQGLAYRIRTLTRNDALNSIVIGNPPGDAENPNPQALPSMLLDRDYPYLRNESVDDGLTRNNEVVIASGYDPLVLAEQTPDQQKDALQYLQDLALAVHGDVQSTKIPTLSIPHGYFHDGGFALCAGSSYVLATRDTNFAIENPSKGLALDPVGLSFILPRLGHEFRQPSANYKGCGIILACLGHRATPEDLMETGLATHYMESPASIGLLEHTLSVIPPWNQQALIKNPIRYHSDPPPVRDHNAQFRNVAVADAVHCISGYAADGGEMWTHRDADVNLLGHDPSLNFDDDDLPWHQDRTSPLVNYAATFNDIFASETSLVGIYEALREIAARTTTDPEEQVGIAVAAGWVQVLERQSPLATTAVFRLLQHGAKPLETLHSCMARERRVQSKLFAAADFQNWVKYTRKTAGLTSPPSPFTGWKHKSLADVSPDEVAELLEAERVA